MRGGRRAVAIGLAVVFVALLARTLWTIHGYAVDVFHWDQWDFLDGLFHPRSFWRLFRRQHGPHRMGIGLPMMIGVARATRWNAVALAYLNAVVVAAAALLAIALKRRVAPPLAWSDLVLPVLFLNSSQWAIYLATPDVSHGPLPLLLVVLFALALTIERPGWRLASLLLVDFLATYTGFGLFLGILTPAVLVLLWWRGELRGPAALVGLAIGTAILASFFWEYRFPWQKPDRRTGGGILAHLGFFVLLFARAVGATRAVSLPSLLGLGATIATCALFVGQSVRLLRRDGGYLAEVLWVLAGFTLLFAAAASSGRTPFGAHAGLNPRYVPYMVPGLLALYLWAAGRPRWRWTVVACVVAYAAIDLGPRSVDTRQMADYRDGKARWTACYRERRDAPACTALARFGIYPDPTSPVLAAKLRVMEERRLGFFADR